MNSVLSAITAVWNQIIYAFSNIRVFDIIDILVMAFIIYKAIGFFRESRAGQLLKGLIILFVVYAVLMYQSVVGRQSILRPR